MVAEPGLCYNVSYWLGGLWEHEIDILAALRAANDTETYMIRKHKNGTIVRSTLPQEHNNATRV